MASSTTTNPSPSSDQSNPNNLSTVSVASFVSSKLYGDKNSNNYSSWVKQIRCLIESQDLLGYIDNSTPPPCSRTDIVVQGWILGALADTVLKDVVKLTSARDVWLELKKIFTPSAPSDQTYEDEWAKYLPLYKATLKGEWKTAEDIIKKDPEAISAKIAFTSQTCLHIAVGTGKAIPFVQQLVNKMPGNQLKVKDQLGYTALHVAALTGNIKAAKILIKRCPDLPLEPENNDRYPVYLAALSAQRNTLRYLIKSTRDDDLSKSPYHGQRGLKLLCIVIDTDMFDVALYLASKYQDLAQLRLRDGNSALGRIALKESVFSSEKKASTFGNDSFPQYLKHGDDSSALPRNDLEDSTILSRERSLNFWERFKSSAFSKYLKLGNGSSALVKIALEDSTILGEERRLNSWEQFIYSVPCAKKILRRKQIHQQASELVKCLCKNMTSIDFKSASGIYTDVMLTAARLDVHEVIEELVATFPTAIYSRNYSNQYIFHVAVENRSVKVFNLIYQMSDLKHQYLNKVDNSGNTLLHLAGRLAPSHKLNLVSGAALQMQRELQWFQEVKKFLHPYSCERSNKAGKTPQMVFTEEHMQLKVEGEKWMKDTSNSCTIAAALIATVVFAAAITVPGGNQSDNGFPLLYTHAAFILFAVSDAISLFTSITSLLMFLSILTSRYAEEDFLRALPKRLCIGLVTLFMSICSMIVAFSATVFMVFGRGEKYWILIPVAVLACLPVTAFAFLQFPLLWDVISNTYGSGIFGKQNNRQFY